MTSKSTIHSLCSDRLTAVFGGTFDPVHIGHAQIARNLLESGRAEQILFVPAGVPPHKRERLISPDYHRLAMLQCLIAEDPRMAVSDLELRREGPSYSIDTARDLSEQFGEHLRLVLGMDSLRDLHLWFCGQELARCFRFLVYRRPGVCEPSQGTLAAQFGPEIAERLLAAIVDGPAVDVSATEIRERRRNRKPVRELLIPAVYDYIAEHGLYLK